MELKSQELIVRKL